MCVYLSSLTVSHIQNMNITNKEIKSRTLKILF